MKTKWRKVKWPFSDSVKSDCYLRPIKRGKIYLRDEPNFPYTVSCGANSDRSHSGCFYSTTRNVATIADAMLELDGMAERL